MAVAVTGGMISPRSRRLSWPWRALLGDLCRAVGYVGAVTTQDAERFVRLGVPPAAVDVTGDPRHDHVLERIPDLAAIAPLVSWSAEHCVLVAGSTHPRDERVVLTAFADLRRAHPESRLLAIPHHPGPRGTSGFRKRAERLGLGSARWPGRQDIAETPVLVVESRGQLVDIYACGRAAYVGGGFQTAGVHAVIEPAVFALPVVFGPQWSGSPDARRLVSDGGATALPGREAAAQLAGVWAEWLADDAARTRAGLRGRGTIKGGAAARTAARLLTALE